MFDPRTAAKHIVATTKLSDPEDIAAEIAAITPPDDIPELYRQLLRDVAREAIRYTNMFVTERPKGSSRVKSIQKAHDAFYDQRVFAQGAWKLLGDCTLQDVEDLAAQRLELAELNRAKAKEFEQLAELMTREGVTTVRELS